MAEVDNTNQALAIVDVMRTPNSIIEQVLLCIQNKKKNKEQHKWNARTFHAMQVDTYNNCFLM